MGFKFVSTVCQRQLYTLFTDKDQTNVLSDLGRQLGSKWRLSLYLENFLFTGRQNNKTWFHNDNYQSFSSSRMTDRSPAIRIGVNYVFRNKVQEKWRNKKRFNNTDKELQNIKAN